MSNLTVDNAYEILKGYIGEKFVSNVSTNKGGIGHSIEKKLGIPISSRHLDLVDGELKTVSLRGNVVKEDLKLAKKWDKQYLKQKLDNLLIVVLNEDKVVVDVQKHSPLKNSTFSKYFDLEYDKIESIGLDKISQRDTIIFVAKTNDSGKKEKNDRALYMSRAFVSLLLGYGVKTRKSGAEQIIEEYNNNV